MRVLYLHQFFMTRAGGGGTRSYEFARHLVKAGHDVTMVTAGKSGDVEGIEVVGVGGAYSDYMRATATGYARRAGAFGRFAAGATAAALRARRPDVVFATSPALTIAVPGVAAARRHRAPLVFEVRDLWPRAPIEMGALRNPAARGAARALERWAYRSAAHVVALSPGIAEGVAATGVPRSRITLIPNASDLDLFRPDLDPGDLRERLGLGDSFVASYFGSMGEANDLTQVVRAAEVLRDQEVMFVLQGEGKRKPWIEAEVRRLGLDNVRVLAGASKEETARLAAASDVCLTIFKDVPVLATNSPNKLFDTFAAGRPAIVNTDGWQRELVERGAGLFARPGDPADLAAQIAKLRDDPELKRRLGEGARRLAEQEFDRRELARRLEQVLESVA